MGLCPTCNLRDMDTFETSMGKDGLICPICGTTMFDNKIYSSKKYNVEYVLKDSNKIFINDIENKLKNEEYSFERAKELLYSNKNKYAKCIIYFVENNIWKKLDILTDIVENVS